MAEITLRHPIDHAKYRVLSGEEIPEIEPLLVPVLDEGRLVYDIPTIDRMRQSREADITRLDPGVRRIMNPHVYHVSLSQELWELKEGLIASTRRSS